MACCNIWDLNWVVIGDPVSCFSYWQSMTTSRTSEGIRKMLFLLLFGPFGFTEMIVFNRKSYDFLQLRDTIKVRLAH